MNTTLAALAGVFAAHLAATMSPGPNVLLVMHTAASRSRRAGVAAALGIATGAALWCVAVLAGLALLAQQSALVLPLLRSAAALYLLWLAWRLWRGANGDAFAKTAAAPAPVQGSSTRAFGQGLATNLANPKALLFYGSVFAALLAPGLPGWARVAAVLIVTVDSALWHVALACLFSTASAQAWYRRAKPSIDRGAALALAALAAALLLIA